ncbi:MAG: hypothetical protein A3G59_02615 [Candidatus Taylorbacteria bacterium RIFCSPLOWO2_12_FULL_47_20]|uniref:POTRA domain-containing protein n=2 Tax=Candidatus Tayloriibacteriota TaxID=1817919 RepID=A0A1G2P7K9_9BACT|nr:MAG: hypothetical protein A3H68_01455 [Candidatus Taylorbacteria bacterium RIFCSPLOWO2_02_FULL_46_40]OHA44290.1 MAG: hypothetical protein A3G59_02615 [Candidatus Taylorbacteria bacterium RIFCSPLOWO2_12_FULL_47_20]
MVKRDLSKKVKPRAVRKRQRRTRFGREFYLWIAAGVTLIVFAIWFFYSDVFRVGLIEVRIETENSVVFSNERDILSETDEVMSRRILGALPGKNILFIPKKKVASVILDGSFSIENVAVAREGWNTVSVVAKERTIYGAWCERGFAQDKNDSREDTAPDTDLNYLSKPLCYYIDEGGFAFAGKNPQDPLGVSVINFVGETRGGLPGGSVLEAADFGRVRDFIEGVRGMGFEPISVYIDGANYFELSLKDRDNPLETQKNGRIIADFSRDISIQLQNLDLIRLEKKIAPNESDWGIILDYIDVRFEDKVYYKMKQK